MTTTATIIDTTTATVLVWAIPEDTAHQILGILTRACGPEATDALWVLTPAD